MNRLLPPPSTFLRFPGLEWKKEQKNHDPIVQPSVLDIETPLPTAPFPQVYYASKEWENRLKYDWEEGGPECPYLPAPTYSESEDIRKSIGGPVRKAIRSRPTRLLKGDFLAFASADIDFAFYVGRIEKIRCHTLFVQFYGDKFLGELTFGSFIYVVLGPYHPCLEHFIDKDGKEEPWRQSYWIKDLKILHWGLQFTATHKLKKSHLLAIAIHPHCPSHKKLKKFKQNSIYDDDDDYDDYDDDDDEKKHDKKKHEKMNDDRKVDDDDEKKQHGNKKHQKMTEDREEDDDDENHENKKNNKRGAGKKRGEEIKSQGKKRKNAGKQPEGEKKRKTGCDQKDGQKLREKKGDEKLDKQNIEEKHDDVDVNVAVTVNDVEGVAAKDKIAAKSGHGRGGGDGVRGGRGRRGRGGRGRARGRGRGRGGGGSDSATKANK